MINHGRDANTYFFNSLPHPLIELTGIINNATEAKGYSSIILILSRRINPNEEDSEKYVLLKSFEQSIINDPIIIYQKVS